MTFPVFFNWMIAAFALVILLLGLENLTRMTPSTNNWIRWALVIKTTGATLLLVVHCVAAVKEVPDRIDNGVAVFALLCGIVLHKVADRRRADSWGSSGSNDA